MVLGKLPPSPNSNANPKPNPDPDRGQFSSWAIFRTPLHTRAFESGCYDVWHKFLNLAIIRVYFWIGYLLPTSKKGMVFPYK